MQKHTILFLGANPVGMERAALDREARDIHAELERSGHRDFEIHTWWAAEPMDLLRALRQLRPTVVHYSGHGGPAGLYFQAPDGGPQLVSTAALQDTFGAAGASVKLVVLDACYSEPQAEALLAHVDCVVGFSGPGGSAPARSFAIGFYGGLGDRESVGAAHRQGCAAIGLQGLPDAERPHLKVRPAIDADQLFLTGEASAVPPPPETPAVLLGILDKLTELTGYRDAQQATAFTDIIEPVFRDLERVHTNYIAIFDEVARSLPEPARSTSDEYRTRLLECAEQLRRQRIAFEPVRTKLRAMTRRVLGGLYGARTPRFPPEADALLAAVVAYFPSGFLAQRSTASLATSLYVAIRASAEPITADDITRDGQLLPALVRETIEDCRDRWSAVCERYADLKMAVTMRSEQ